MLIDGRHIADVLLKKTAAEVTVLKQLGVVPKLAVVLVGNDKPSQKYVKMKKDAAERVGIDFDLVHLPADIDKKTIISTIKTLQADLTLSGLMIQLPLPEPLFTTDVLNVIDPDKDVECLTDVNLGKLVMKTNNLTPPTAGSVMHILDELQVDLKGKNVTIMGTGVLVGKPLAIMMMNKEASVTTCNVYTKNIKEKCLEADIIITGVGKKDILRGDMVKPSAIVIDTGISFEGNKVYGDVHMEEVAPIASHITPTPGGVGPVTVSHLLWNTVLCAKMKRQK